ncbi:hypothetical protein N7457_006342 [Penicillium paradoxum]|uniref:uncharacterized protein n=1 Tax=Penicillium paradoxum TaxID=176176 RepID=UPI00254780E6|nr:uncharacterized protein N7457_006342 [Penicillium paradoxum]KAJ5781182.1 hypothetical protein N7457_006342 [Penicillium paradoxum]
MRKAFYDLGDKYLGDNNYCAKRITLTWDLNTVSKRGVKRDIDDACTLPGDGGDDGGDGGGDGGSDGGSPDPTHRVILVLEHEAGSFSPNRWGVFNSGMKDE